MSTYVWIYAYVYVCMFVCMCAFLYTSMHSCMYLYSLYAHKRMGCSPAHEQSFRVCVCMCLCTCKRRACTCMYIPMSSPPPRSWPCPYISGVRPRALRSNPQRLPTPTPNGLLPKGAFSLPRHGTEGVSSGTDCAAGLYARPALRWWMKLPANSRRVSPHSRRIEGIALVDEAA